MKTKRVIASLICLAAILGASAKPAPPPAANDTLTAARVFADLPVSVLDMLDRSTRLDMLDYAAVDSVYAAPNLLEGYSRLTKLTPTYARVELTDVSTLQIKLLPSKKYGDVIMVLYTVGSPTQASDTGIQFFDPQFRELKLSDCFRRPEVKDFFDVPKDSGHTLKELEAMIPFPNFKIEASPDADTAEVTLSLGSTVDLDDLALLQTYLRPSLTYTWSGRQMK